MAVLFVEGWEGLTTKGQLVGPSGGNDVFTTYAAGYSAGQQTAGVGVGPGFTAGAWSRGAFSPGVSNEWYPLRNTNATHVYGAVRVYLTGFPTSFICGMGSSTDWDMAVGVNGSGVAILWNQSVSATVGTGTTPLYANAWNLIEWEVTLGDSAAANVWVHGLATADIAVTGQDFKHGTETTFRRFGLGSQLPGIDDVIIYDDTGSRNNARVGDKIVVGLFPSGKGDQEQWEPKKTTATARFYFPYTTRGYFDGSWRYGAPAPVGVAVDSVWDYTNTVENEPQLRGRLTPEKFTSPNETTNRSDESRPAYDVSGSAPFDLFNAQYISPALGAQTISGTAKMYLAPSEEITADNVSSQLVIRVVSNDGQTVRGTLYAGDTDATNPPSNEWGSYVARAFPRGATTNFALSSLAISEGDRLVVEFGGRMRGPARNSVQIGFVVGSEGATDLPENETDTDTTKNGWLEFSSALTLSDDGNWDHVTQTPEVGDELYVKTDVDNDLDLYAMSNLPASYTADGPILIRMIAKKAEPGARTLTHAYKTSGATQTGSAIGLSAGSYVATRTYLDEDATDSAAWTDTKLNALQVGPKATT